MVVVTVMLSLSEILLVDMCMVGVVVILIHTVIFVAVAGRCWLLRCTFVVV